MTQPSRPRRYPAQALSPAAEAWDIMRELVLDNERQREKDWFHSMGCE